MYDHVGYATDGRTIMHFSYAIAQSTYLRPGIWRVSGLMAIPGEGHWMDEDK